MKPRIIALALIVAAVAAGWWFDAPARFRAWRTPDDGRLTLYGNVDIRQVQLGFRVAGRLASMHFEEGDAVKTGDTLAKLDERPLKDNVRAAEAQVASLQATLSKLIAGARDAEIAQARSAVSERESDVENTRLTFERAERLRYTGASSDANYDIARTARDVSLARLNSSREALKILLEGSRKEDLAAARANLEGAEANLAAAQTALADATMLAPSDGVILSRVKEPGAILQPSDVVYVLSLTKPVWVRAYVSEPLLGRIRPGMELLVTTDTRPNNPYRGRVGFISSVAEFTPKTVQTPELRTDLVYRLRVIINDADDGLRQGMPVTVTEPMQAATR